MRDSVKARAEAISPTLRVDFFRFASTPAFERRPEIGEDGGNALQQLAVRIRNDNRSAGGGPLEALVMQIFGKKIGGGRRTAARERLPLPAVISTSENSVVAELVDLSRTCARLRGEHLPPAGATLSLRLECVRAFGTVAWSTELECGVAFDSELSRFELNRLRREVTVAAVIWNSVDERLAARDWRYGVAR